MGLRRIGWLILSWIAVVGLAGCGKTEDCGESTSCDGVCRFTSTDDDHCGACGEACEAGSYCDTGSCVLFCGAGSAECDGACVGVASNAAHCGGCDVDCGELYCDAGSCSPTCSGVLCPSLGASACAHLESDPDHCGSCGNACGAGSECRDGQCVAACAPGRAACGAACVDLQHSVEHCGVCGNACAAGVACEDGVCAGAAVCETDACCEGAGQACSGACLDTSSNVFHCGGCGVACAAGQSCTEGACTCPDAGLLCAGACVDAQTNGRHCGSCGHACAGGMTCVGGSCACQSGETECDGRCVDLEKSRANCGACGNRCAELETCEEGVCFSDADDDCGGRASDVEISRVSLFQSVEAVLYDGSNVVEPGARDVDVIEGKEALVRVHVKLGPGFVPRQLSARLQLETSGTSALLFKKKQITGDSRQNDLNTTINLAVPASAIQADSTFHVELVECGADTRPNSGVTRVPETGTAELGARRTGNIQVSFLPIRYNNQLPDTSAEAIQKYADEVMKQFGVTEVVTNVLPEFGNYSGPVDMDALLDEVLAKRSSDKPTREIYYYGLLRSHASVDEYCEDDCTLGIAYIPERSAQFRVGLGVAYGDATSHGTFAHELGHNLERQHAPCGDPDDPDESYPYSEALIGKWGYDGFAGQLKSPSDFFDLMGYCEPTWISDYTFNGINDVIASLHKSASRARLAARTWESLRVTPTGVRWSSALTLDVPPEKVASEAIVYDASGAEIDRVEAYRFESSEGRGYRLLVPPAEPGWYAIGLSGDVALPYP